MEFYKKTPKFWFVILGVLNAVEQGWKQLQLDLL